MNSTSQLTTNQILNHILQTKKYLTELNEDGVRFITIWNFDNTILHGDCSDGLKNGAGQIVFKGLQQMAIEAGFSKDYPPVEGFERFTQDENALELVDEPAAFAFYAKIFAGTLKYDLQKLAKKYFHDTMRSHFFKASVDLINSFKKEKIENYVITASSKLFVQGASESLGIPHENMFGMDTQIIDGKLTDQLISPLSTREGKIAIIKQIQEKILVENPTVKKVYVLAGFGNNNANDKNYLDWIAAQEFEAGQPLAVIGFQAPILRSNHVSLLLVE